MAEHGFKMEQKKDNKVATTGSTPVNKNKPKSKSSGGGKQMDPALIQAIMMMLAQRQGEMPSGGPGGPGGLSLPPGAVPMGPPPAGNPALQGRMGMMPPIPAGMPAGGPPVR